MYSIFVETNLFFQNNRDFNILNDFFFFKSFVLGNNICWEFLNLFIWKKYWYCALWSMVILSWRNMTCSNNASVILFCFLCWMYMFILLSLLAVYSSAHHKAYCNAFFALRKLVKNCSDMYVTSYWNYWKMLCQLHLQLCTLVVTMYLLAFF